MSPTLHLEAGMLSAEIDPAVGGGVARFDLATSRGRQEIFRGRRAGAGGDPNALGLYVLAPWSNRISGGGFGFGGAFHALSANLAGEPFPIHGDAWQAAWTVEDCDQSHVRLTRESRGPGPFRYHAQLDYRLSGDSLAIRLALANQGDATLPFGAGFHPWLPRTPGTRLAAPARAVWLEDERHLPTQNIPVASRPEWDFARPRPLPQGWINNGFIGWDGRASVVWEDRGIALTILASPPIGTYILYSPAADAAFFCFEPVTHAVDAHNLPPGPKAHGLKALAPGEQLVSECLFEVRADLAASAPQTGAPA